MHISVVVGCWSESRQLPIDTDFRTDRRFQSSGVAEFD